MASPFSLAKDQPFYQALLLGLACTAVSLLLIAGNASTHEKIRTLIEQDKIHLLAQVLPAEFYNNSPLEETISVENKELSEPATLMLAKKDGELTAAIIQLTVAGWGGPLQILMAVDPAGQLLGVRIISHKETPGLADGIEAEKSDWIEQFTGRSLLAPEETGWAVKKDGGEFDQFTGATITPRAVVKGVYLGLSVFRDWKSKATAFSEDQ